ncbi:hypothetical protein Hanom_Chr10g00903321 [Helianthus anomalus]
MKLTFFLLKKRGGGFFSWCAAAHFCFSFTSRVLWFLCPPVGVEVINLIIEDDKHYKELEGQLNWHLLENSDQIRTTTYYDSVDKQHIIENNIKEELLHDLYSRDCIYANRY